MNKCEKTKATFFFVTNDQNAFVTECSVDSSLENCITASLKMRFTTCV